MINVENRHITVAGAARSGVAVAELLERKGAQVLISDAGIIAPEFRYRLLKAGIPFEEQGHTEKAMAGEILVLSPGVPSDAPIVTGYQAAGKPVVSEIEVAAWYCKSRIIAVTGSNGKTTVVNWLADVWKRAGRAYLLAGNVGTAFSEIIDQTSPDTDVILEVSSFQLDHIDRFRAQVAVLLNITPDHLNRYHNQFEQYITSKMQLPAHQTADDILIYGYDDPVVKGRVERLEQQQEHPGLIPFSSEKEVPGACISDGIIRIRTKNFNEDFLSVNELALPGKHNIRNGLAVAMAARICEIDKRSIRESLTNFEGVPHRLQKIRELDGVTYFNDSKATNVNAVWYALNSFHQPVVLIMGGQDKGNDYSELIPEIQKKVKVIVAIGEGRNSIKSQLNHSVPEIVFAESMHDAVQISHMKAEKNDVVLLSPACASFDMFENYEDRGLKFIQAVMTI